MQMHPTPIQAMMVVAKQTVAWKEQDATQDYTESCPPDRFFRLWRSRAAGEGRGAHYRARGPASRKRPRRMLWVRQASARLRQSSGPAVRVRSSVGHRLLPSLRYAESRVPSMRRYRGSRALGGWQVPSDASLLLVLGTLGTANELEGGGRDLSHHMGKRLPR